jgi:hypothetical protein
MLREDVVLERPRSQPDDRDAALDGQVIGLNTRNGDPVRGSNATCTATANEHNDAIVLFPDHTERF